MPYVCLGIGTNIDPRDNLTTGLTRLFDVADTLWVSDILETPPVDMPSRRRFLNTVVWFRTAREAHTLKAWLNDVEEQMGRDRSDPERSTSDRSIDFDILWTGEDPLPPATLPDADTPYFGSPYARLRAKLLDTALPAPADARRVELVVSGRRVGVEPTAIDAQRRAGDEIR